MATGIILFLPNDYEQDLFDIETTVLKIVHNYVSEQQCFGPIFQFLARIKLLHLILPTKILNED